ncbi:MAG: HAMP domain-containing histidine kinase, partial [Gammaproteobacteria bacterium]|nr:HAMP domain-containing histidine kinase [Gammaproteobacteria bacterium]
SLKPVCVITIADNGSGISIANQEFIFQPFFTTARGQGGSGLGLAVTSSLLNAHRGSIKLVTSKTGAAFEIILPLED